MFTAAEAMYQEVKQERDSHKALLLDIYQRLAHVKGLSVLEVRRDIRNELNLLGFNTND